MGQIENSLLLDIVIEILGNPRKENVTKSQFSFDCPVCSAEKDMPEGDGKGNFEVNLSKGVYHCWSCGGTHNTHGSIGKLITKFGRKDHKKKLKQLGIQLSEVKSTHKVIQEVREIHLPEEYIPFEGTNPNSLPYKEAWNYLTKQRNLQPDIIYKHKHKLHSISSTLVSYGENKHFSAMSKTVGMPMAILTKLILTKQISSLPSGVLIPTMQQIYKPVLKELAKHQIVFTEKIN